MFWRDHQPSHFHARYGDEEVIVEIETGKVTCHITQRALNMIQEWREQHIEELLTNWKLAEQSKPLFQINPLE